MQHPDTMPSIVLFIMVALYGMIMNDLDRGPPASSHIILPSDQHYNISAYAILIITGHKCYNESCNSPYNSAR